MISRPITATIPPSTGASRATVDILVRFEKTDDLLQHSVVDFITLNEDLVL